MLKQIEGSRAVAEAVAMCRPQVICAYPITPQTHIVEALSAMVKKEQLKAEFLNVESEFAAMSVAIGASAAGARAYPSRPPRGVMAGRLTPHLSTVIAGLGGRSITRKSLRAMLATAAAGELGSLTFLDLDTAMVDRELARMRAAPAASRPGTGSSPRTSAASRPALAGRTR